MARAPKKSRTPARPAARRLKAPAASRPTAAEKRLLALAQEIRHLPLPAALEALADAWAPGAPLPREVAQAWLRSRGGKTATLALAWAREQVRLSLQETVEALPPDRRGRVAAGADTLAWVLLAACEALAHEPPSAVADRMRALDELIGHAAATG
jgi:hypothetical protein